MTRFTILMYHMISKPLSNEEVKYACPPELFDRHMSKLRQSGFNPISLKLIDDHFNLGAEIPNNSVIITLDDGFEDNYLNALPILKKHNIPATIFLTTGYLGATNAWMTKRGFPERKMLNWEQIQEMSQHNIEFGAHTISHPRLPEIDNEAVSNEISISKQTIETTLGKRCNFFAYPFGLFSAENRNQVDRAGFSLACSTRSGFNTTDRDALTLHRIEVYGNDPWWKLQQKMTFGMNDASLFYPAKYYLSRLFNRLIS